MIFGQSRLFRHFGVCSYHFKTLDEEIRQLATGSTTTLIMPKHTDIELSYANNVYIIEAVKIVRHIIYIALSDSHYTNN